MCIWRWRYYLQDAQRRTMMHEQTLTKEERLCLQRWFRQALAKVEHDEVTAQFIQSHGLTSAQDSHRSMVVKRRTRRSGVFTHLGALTR